MKNINRFTISALMLAIVFAGSSPAFAHSESQANRLALLGSTEVLGNLELDSNGRFDMGNMNLLKANMKADVRTDLKASTSVRGDNNRDDNRSNMDASSNANVRANVGVRAEDHWDNRSSDKYSDDRENNNRSWFGWLVDIFRKDHSTTTASTTTSVNASTTADSARPMIYKKVRFVTASASTTASSTTTVTWNTNENTYGAVRFATSTASGTPSTIVLDGNLATSHTVTLTGLDLDTKYFVTITATDASGNVTTSGALKFVPKEGKSENITISANAFVRLWHSIFW